MGGVALAITAIASIWGAHSSHEAGKAASDLRDEQARIAREKAAELARRHKLTTEKLLSKQRAAYAAGGVTRGGSPAIVGLLTEREASAERKKILELGGLESSYLENLGDAEYDAGLADAFGFLLGGASTILTGLNRPAGDPTGGRSPATSGGGGGGGYS